MKVLVTGSGGREHALAWRLSMSDRVTEVHVAPGNAGTDDEPNMRNVPISPMDFEALETYVRDQGIDLTVIGPEDPLVAGMVDHFEAAGLPCFGPGRAAAQLEGRKSYAKAFLKKYGIPTADYQVFEDPESAVKYIAGLTPPIVIKADGLAAGKGVVLAGSRGEAEDAARDMLDGKVLSGAGSSIVIEEFLVGEEASFIVIADGENFLPFATSQDHKAAYDGDKGPNTGGMGAYSPAPIVTPAVQERVINEIIRPTLAGMRAEGCPFVGFLYAGLMIDAAGSPKVIEFNCRFGDPETQPIMVRLKTDLVDLIEAALAGRLDGESIEFDPRSALTVVMASGGYPGSYETGVPIHGLGDVRDAKVFHAGTGRQGSEIVTTGGRVLGVTALGNNVSDARRFAYGAVAAISFDRAAFRTDIGYRAVERETVS